jgi:hypothetical protein
MSNESDVPDRELAAVTKTSWDSIGVGDSVLQLKPMNTNRGVYYQGLMRPEVLQA